MLRLLAVQVLVVAILFSAFPSISVYAASKSYKLSELGLEVTIPSGYSVITRNTSASDSIFDRLGTSKSEMISHFTNSGIYLSAISDKNNEEIVVTMVENNISNLSLLSDTVLNVLAETLATQYADYGIKVLKHEIYQHSQAKFIKIKFTDTGKTVYGLQYYTIYDGKAMNFTMRSYEGSLSSKQETAIKTVVDSIKYDKAPPVTEEGEDTNKFTYTDTDSGVKFVVPENWQQKELSKDREFIDVKFASTKEVGATIMYGSTDAWAKTPESEKIGRTRADLNNSAFTKLDISEMCNTTADKISTVTYNGVEYFKSEASYTSDAYGVDITAKMILLVYIDNGWLYMFQFGGESTHKLYSDFERLLDSVQYPTVSSTQNIGLSNNTSLNVNNSSNHSGSGSDVKVLIVLLVVAIIVVVVVIIYNKKTSRTIDQTCEVSVLEEQSNNESTIMCEKCGQALPIDSSLCHICGARINNEENVL